MRFFLFGVSGTLLIISACLALTIGQVDPLAGTLVYFHVPSSMCALLCFCVMLVTGIGFLSTRNMSWDTISASAAEVGLVFATVLNLTGMVFSRALWNVWWTPSPRLISSAILWFLYVAYIILRSSISSEHRRARIGTVFSFIAFLDVPLVYISARIIPDIHKPNFSFDTSGQYAAFGLGMLGTILLAASLLWFRYDILSSKSRLERLTFSEQE